MAIVELAAEVELRGLRSMYLPEHTHVPVGSEQLESGYSLDERYRRTLDPFVSCAFVAATTRLEVGTGVTLVGQHDAIALAKAIATLDHLSGGRVVIGVGYGSNLKEAVDHGVSTANRVPVVEETVRLMKEMWSDDAAEFHGRHRSVSLSWAWPKPTRPGGPPILLGARASDATFERIVAWADGWLPVGADVGDPAFAERLGELRRRWRDRGRTGEPEICYFLELESHMQMERQIAHAGELGIQRLQVSVGEPSREQTLPILDRLAAAVGAATTEGKE